MAFTLSLGVIVSSSVYLLSLTFCCLHSIHCTCYVPCDDDQSTYLLYLPLNTYLLFSWWHPVHWPLSLLACLPHLFIWILTLTFLPLVSARKFLRYALGCRFCDLSQRPLPPQFSAFTIYVAEHFLSYVSLEVTLPWASGLLHWCPAHYQLWLEIFSFIVLPLRVLCLSWASGLSLCSQAHYQL